MASSNVRTKILVEFEALYDIAWGIIKYIKDKANSPVVFDQHVIYANDLSLTNFLHERTEYNPLFMAATDEYINKIDVMNDLYKEIITKRYDEVLKRSRRTDIFKLLNMYHKIEGVASVSVLCNKSIEEQFIKNLIEDFNIVYSGFNTDVNEYDVLIVDDYTHVLKYYLSHPIGGKEVICFDCKYNMEPNGRPGEPLRLITGPISDINIIKTICPYAMYVPAEG